MSLSLTFPVALLFDGANVDVSSRRGCATDQQCQTPPLEITDNECTVVTIGPLRLLRAVCWSFGSVDSCGIRDGGLDGASGKVR